MPDSVALRVELEALARAGANRVDRAHPAHPFTPANRLCRDRNRSPWPLAMQYALLIYENVEALEGREMNDYALSCRAYQNALLQAGVYVSGANLRSGETATTLWREHGKPQIRDDTDDKTSRHLARILILDLPSLVEAIRWANRCPASTIGAIEIRQINSSEGQSTSSATN
jgi:hypothetical protein